MNEIRGECLSECGYLTQIATMADTSSINTDGPLLAVSADAMVWVPMDAEHRATAWSAIVRLR